MGLYDTRLQVLYTSVPYAYLEVLLRLMARDSGELVKDANPPTLDASAYTSDTIADSK